MARTEPAPIARYRRIVSALKTCVRASEALAAETDLRWAMIHTARLAGHRATDIAGVLGVTRQTVYRMAARGADLDGPLFADLDDVVAADRACAAARRRLWKSVAEARRAGATIADIAEVIGMSEPTVKTQLAAARGGAA